VHKVEVKGRGRVGYLGAASRLTRASINGRIIRQKIWPKRPKLDGPAYEYAQNKMAGIHVTTTLHYFHYDLCFSLINQKVDWCLLHVMHSCLH